MSKSIYRSFMIQGSGQGSLKRKTCLTQASVVDTTELLFIYYN